MPTNLFFILLSSLSQFQSEVFDVIVGQAPGALHGSSRVVVLNRVHLNLDLEGLAVRNPADGLSVRGNCFAAVCIIHDTVQWSAYL